MKTKKDFNNGANKGNDKSIFSARQLRKKNKSSTRGKDKGGNCVASRLDRFCAGYSRARKLAEYNEWLIKTRRANNQ